MKLVDGLHHFELGMQLMVITQEEENEQLPGKMTTLRKLYYRELIARFAHHHAILWDLSEEMDRWRYYKTPDITEICDWFKKVDPWQHPTQYVRWKGEIIPEDKGYARLLGFPNLDGTAMQHDAEHTHSETLRWVDASAKAGHKWLVGLIEINPTSTGVVPDKNAYEHDVIRKNSIWGNLMAGGSGTAFFFGYEYPNTGEVYAVYLPDGGSVELDPSQASGNFEIKWYDPRHGGELQEGSVRTVSGGSRRSLGQAPKDPQADWAVLVRRPQAAPSRTVSRKTN